MTNYDHVAGEYARTIYAELKDKPFDREMLDRFADRARARGPVCDLGCGPGQIARYLRDRDCDALGLDLSSGMLAEAARLNPDVPLIRANMHALPLRTEALAGIAAFYSIIHVPRDQATAVLRELRRVLRPGGCLLLAFHLGTDMIHATDFHGHMVDWRVTLFERGEMIGYVEESGLSIAEATERDPYPDVEYQSRRGYVLAVRPAD